ncbi:hypothetical protein DPEC_G00134810 [Dallia pectoralis]|uniref:Uncharacterized protein n=1 Tax=Dallia pectoralis TaxID=75939 RepID=A0ACC2GSI6_DALPE|nr:hypothetical protein DPEC_G00134810 [Dallia pectoralis]
MDFVLLPAEITYFQIRTGSWTTKSFRTRGMNRGTPGIRGDGNSSSPRPLLLPTLRFPCHSLLWASSALTMVCPGAEERSRSRGSREHNRANRHGIIDEDPGSYNKSEAAYPPVVMTPRCILPAGFSH